MRSAAATIGGKGKRAEVDGGYFGGYVKPANRRENRRDRRLRQNQSGKRKVVVVIRERGGKTLPGVFESEAEALNFIRRQVPRETELYADEAGSWNELHARYTLHRINHQEAYSLPGEVYTNNAEVVLLPHAPRRDRPSSSCRRPVPDPLRSRGRVARGSSQRAERLPGRPACRAGDAQQAERRFLRVLAAVARHSKRELNSTTRTCIELLRIAVSRYLGCGRGDKGSPASVFGNRFALNGGEACIRNLSELPVSIAPCPELMVPVWHIID